jgi:hypothetical protein
LAADGTVIALSRLQPKKDSMLSQRDLSGLEHAIAPNHHEGIEQRLLDLGHESYGEDSRALCECWARFERELQEHFCDEQIYLFPAFSQAHPEEARPLLAEHAQIRQLVTELGIGVELHNVRAERIEKLLVMLRAHSQREDELLYPWALRHLA